MIHKTRTKALSWLLSLALVLSLLPGLGGTAKATSGWTGGTYTASANETINGDVTVSENATLTINAGVTVTVNGTGGDDNGAISIAAGKTLTVTGGGTLEVKGKSNNNGGEEAIRFSGNGTLSVENATVKATGGDKTDDGSGQGGFGIINATVTVNGGTVEAIGGNGYTGENPSGGGHGFNSCTITVNGGTLNATGGTGGTCNATEDDYARPGSGADGIYSGSVTVNGGTLTATGGAKGTGFTGSKVSEGGKPKDGKGINGATITTSSTVEESDNGTAWTAVSGNTSDKRYVKVEAAASLDPVASVTPSGGTATNYTDFAEAVTAWTTATQNQKGATLKLLADVETSSEVNVNAYTASDSPMILDLNGYGIRHTGTSGSVISVGNDGRLKLTDSDASSRKHYITLDENGRGISVADSGTPGDSRVEVTGGYITGGLGRNTGGTNTMGGGVWSNNGFTMEGGTIIGNTVSPSSGEGRGGGVYVGVGIFTMTGGTITRNRASTSGGGVCVQGGSTFKLSGNAVIKDNLKGTDKDNVYLSSGRKITITDALTNSDPIGVTMQTPGVFTEGGKAKDYAAKFTSDNTAYSVMVDGDELKLSLPPVAYMAWDEASKTVKAVEGGCTSYTVVTSSTTTWEDGKWYVVKDNVSINQYGNNRITVSGTANLILCDGATLTAPLGITVADGSTLNIYAQSGGTGKLMIECRDSAAMNAAIGGLYNSSGAGGAGGVVNIHGGEIIARTISGQGAGIGGGAGSSSGGAGGTVTIYGGKVTTAGGSSGAGIGGGYGSSTGGAGGTVTIYGGEVTAVGSTGAGIGGGAGSAGGAGGTVAIYGGTVKTEAGGNLGHESSVGIGGGYRSGGGRGTDGTLTLGTGMHLYGGTSANPETDLSKHVAQNNGDYARSRYMTVNNVAPHTHSFTYTADGATITATCGNHDGCPLASSTYQAKLTIAAPEHTNVGDGKSAEVTITDANNIKGSATVSYYAATKSGTAYTKTGDALGSAPDAAGNYVAEITVGGVTAFVGYTISKTAQAAPTGFKSTPAATPYANGSIDDGEPAINKTNLQVSSDGGKTWADVTQFPVSGKLGVYQFKYKETDALSESPVTSVLLEATNELREVKITSDKTDANLYKDGETNILTAVTNTNVTGLTLEYAWYREGVAEAVGTGATYTLQASDVGKKLTVVVTDKTSGATEPYASVSTATPVIVTVAPTTYQITGNVKVPDAENSSTFNNVANANVELRQGNTVFATATTDSSGNYTFSSVPNGEYNIVVTDADGTTKTEYVKVENGNQTINVTMPFYKVSSKVDVKGETPAAVVAGLDDAAANSLTADEKASGVTTTMTMEIESTDDLTAKADDQLTEAQKQEKTEQQAIKDQNTGTDKSDALDFIDMSVYKRTQKTGESAQVEDVHNLNKVLEILLPYTTANRSFNIFRYHGTAATKFTRLSNRPTTSFADGQFFVGDGFIAIYASGFSTYAIGYSDATQTPSPSSGGGSSGGSSGSTITVPVSGDSASVSVSASVSGSTATVKAPTAAQLDKVIGESVKTGDVTIDVSGLNKDIAAVSIPTETVKAIEKAVSDPDNDADALTVKLTDGSVTFDAKALAAVVDQAKGSTVQLNLDNIGESKLKTAQKTAIKDMDVQAVYDAYMTSNGQRISDFKGGKATVTVSYTLKDGQIGRGVVVWYVAEDGKTTEVPTTYTSKEVTFTVEHFSNYVIAYDEARAAVCPQDETCPISKFTDADPTAWYHDGVHYVLENGIMSGYGNGLFGPGNTTNRAMMAQILWNMEGKPVVNYAISYTDVDAEAWYTEAVRWVTSEKIMSGYGGGKFGPGDAMTREQLVTIMYRYAQYKGVDVSVGEDTNILSYDDALTVSEFAIPAMQWAVGSGVVSGRTNTTLNPKDTATRAEIATIIMRYCTEIAK